MSLVNTSRISVPSTSMCLVSEIYLLSFFWIYFLTVVILLLRSKKLFFLKMVQDSPWACNRILLLKEIERKNTLSSSRDFHSVKWFTEDEEKDEVVWGPHTTH